MSLCVGAGNPTQATGEGSKYSQLRSHLSSSRCLILKALSRDELDITFILETLKNRKLIFQFSVVYNVLI